MCCKSRQDAGKVYYVHKATGTTQLGMPCAGPLEDLPPGWEKVASSKPGGQPFYFNRDTGASQHEKPEVLPPGWRRVVSTRGRVFYWHEETQKSQFDKPRVRLPEAEGTAVPVTPPMDDSMEG